jgi:hypothetical protein
MSKICIICKQKIIEKKERWVRLTDFNKGQEVGQQYYHLECWRDRFNISNSERKKKMYSQAQKSIGNILSSLGIEQTKYYEIPENR